MNYATANSSVTQMSLDSKLQCFALCARQETLCNIAVFNAMADLSCLLSNEQFIGNKLIPMNNSVVINFQRNNNQEVFFTTMETTTTAIRFNSTKYGSLLDNGVNDMRNDFIIFNRHELISQSGYVSNVSVKFCTLPTTAQSVLWVYVMAYTGSNPYFIPRLMYQVPYNEINTVSSIQEFIIPDYQLNVTAGQYVGIGFGKTTGGSPCRVIPGNSSYTNMYGGANQTTLFTAQASYGYTSQTRAVSISFTVVSPW